MPPDGPSLGLGRAPLEGRADQAASGDTPAAPTRGGHFPYKAVDHQIPCLPGVTVPPDGPSLGLGRMPLESRTDQAASGDTPAAPTRGGHFPWKSGGTPDSRLPGVTVPPDGPSLGLGRASLEGRADQAASADPPAAPTRGRHFPEKAVEHQLPCLLEVTVPPYGHFLVGGGALAGAVLTTPPAWIPRQL